MALEAACSFVSRHGRPFFVALLLGASATTLFAQSSDSLDPFLAKHQTGIARNKFGSMFSVRFKDGRTVFNPRERIELELVFQPPDGINPDARESPDGWASSTVVLDHEDGVATPLRPLAADFVRRQQGGLGRVYGGTIGGPATPVILPLTLNTWYRFDQPGRYRLFVQSRHRGGSETSNILAFDLHARDAASEEAAVQRATRILDDPAADPHAAELAVRDLRALATNEAAVILARHYDGSSRIPLGIARAGLFTVSDRGFMVQQLEQQLALPQRPIEWWFVRDLALLEVAEENLLFAAQ